MQIERRWIPPEPVEISSLLLEAAGGDEFLARALVRRGITAPENLPGFINPDLYVPSPPEELPDMEKACARLKLAVERGERVGVWGDFDVDGQTSTTLLVSALNRLDAKTAYYIPIRAIESHGITIPGLQKFLGKGIDLLISCDTGVAAHEAVEFASRQNVDVIITDHHTLPDALPKAYAVVNPQRLPSDHPLFPLCGVGCAYKVVEKLYQDAGLVEELEAQLDLVALGTIADLAVLRGDNRYLVQRGLRVLRSNRRVGLKALFEAAGIQPDNLTEEAISFFIAPRMNAIGRIDNANPVVDFLITTDTQKASVFALQLEGMNARRKLLCDQVLQAALSQIENNPALLEDPVLILSHPEWPAGVIGIAASQLVELFSRPVIMISTPPGKTGRGSARSIEGINITHAIATAGHHLVGYGGHAMAAGLGIQDTRLPDFRRAMVKEIGRLVQDKPPAVQITIDEFLPLDRLTLEWVEKLERLAPFGPGNKPFTFAAQNLTIAKTRTIGRSADHLEINVLAENGVSQRVIRWNSAGTSLPESRFDLAYTVRSTTFKGQKEIQVEWLDARLIEEFPITLQAPARPKTNIIDQRDLANREDAFRFLEGFEGVLIWREGEAAQDLPGVGRHNIGGCKTLALWNSPPSRQVMDFILEVAQPRDLILLNLDTPSDHPSAFLKRLGGLIKYVIATRSGQTAIIELAGALNQEEKTTLAGLEWFTARGNVTFTIDNNQQVNLFAGAYPTPEKLPEIERQLKILLDETSAFRAFYRRTEPENFLPGEKSSPGKKD